MQKGCITVGITLALGAFAAAAQVPQPIQITISGAEVEATGLTDPGPALLFGVLWEKIPGTLHLSTHAELAPVAAGVVALDLAPERDPIRSVWVVVDLVSGAYAISASDPVKDPLVPDLGNPPTLAVDPGGYSVLASPQKTLELIIARPGVGAWRHTASDGGLVDEDGDFDGTLTVNLAAALPVGSTPDTFSEVQLGDLVIGLDPYSGDAFVLEVGP